MHTDSSNTGMKLVTLLLNWEQEAFLQGFIMCRKVLCNQHLYLQTHRPEVLKMGKCVILVLPVTYLENV